jgi:hypothetical protein
LERQWHYLEWLCWSVLNFSWIRLWHGILLAVLAGVLYSIYLLMSKSAFSDGRTLFHDNQHPFINGIFRYCLYPTWWAIFGFSDAGWFVLFIQAVVCQLTAWLSISYATHIRTTRFHWVY